LIWRVGELIDQNTDELADLESLNAGMVPMQAKATVTVSADSSVIPGWSPKIEGIASAVHTAASRHRMPISSVHPQGALWTL